jgi:hypothetical protein
VKKKEEKVYLFASPQDVADDCRSRGFLQVMGTGIERLGYRVVKWWSRIEKEKEQED